MTKPVVTIDINKTAKQAGELIKKTRKGALIVVKSNKPIGILTDSDLIKKVIAKNVLPSKVKIKNIMSKPLITVSSDDDIIVATKKLKRSNIKRLPVVDKGKIVGVISLTDIAVTSPEMIYILENRLRLKEEEQPFEIKERFTSGICDSCGNYGSHLEYMNDQWLCDNCREEEE
jgi:CBS-domain-containing membrane protein